AASTNALNPPADTTEREYTSQIASGAANTASARATTSPADSMPSPAAPGSKVTSAIGPPIDAAANPTKTPADSGVRATDTVLRDHRRCRFQTAGPGVRVVRGEHERSWECASD